ncbi:MAG: hypothetical protein ACK2U4_21750 [Candidatus Promineifilaceae bacterium]|jgi:hypothetical protein
MNPQTVFFHDKDCPAMGQSGRRTAIVCNPGEGAREAAFAGIMRSWLADLP